MTKTNIATVAIGVIELIEVGKEIYQATADAMDAIEAKGKLKGSSKKDWVMDFMRDFVFSLGQNWDDWFLLIFNFIDKIKAVYNLVKPLF